ncbi:MAG: glycosyltransferase family 39 protein, partial [Gemmatimonadaceae bacterium]
KTGIKIISSSAAIDPSQIPQVRGAQLFGAHKLGASVTAQSRQEIQRVKYFRSISTWLRTRDGWEIATLVLLFGLAALICVTFQDYGMSWDEDFSRWQGRDFLAWYGSGFRNRAVMSHANAEYVYGSLFNVVSLVASDHSPFGPFETSHLLIATLGLVSVFFAYRVGKLLSGPMAGFFSALILTLTPTYYGHMFMNPKDVPFAVFFIVAVYYLLRAYDRLPRLELRTIVVTGLAMSLPMSVRPAGMLLLVYFVILVGFWFVAQFWKNPSRPLRATWKDIQWAGVSFLPAAAISWVLMLAWWPYGQLRPISNPLEIFLKSTKFTEWHWTILYRGTYIQSGFLPWHYLPGSFLVTLPEFYPLAIVGGAAALIVWALRRRAAPAADIDSRIKLAFFVFVAFFPLAAAIVMKPIMYDGTRLFLFVLPPLAVVSGVVFARLISGNLPLMLKSLLTLILVGIAGATVVDMIRLHPYEYVFFNRSSGGLPAANGKYETEYWATSYKEGIEWVMRNYEPDAPVASVRVANLSNPILTFYYLATEKPHQYRFLQVDARDHPNVVLSITRWNQQLSYPGRVLYVVERMGTPLLYVTEVRPVGAP